MQPDLFSLLQQHLRAAISKRPGRTVMLWGEPGIGKTHLVKSLLSSASCAHLVLSVKQLNPHMVQLLPNYQKFPAWMKHNKDNSGLSLAGMFDAFVAALNEVKPLVLVIDGLHEATPEQLEWIKQLAQTIKGMRGLTIIVTARSSLEHFQNYQLEALDQHAATHLLNENAKGILPNEGITWVYKRAKGNPLFLLEYWRYLLRQGCFWSDGQHWHWRAPEAGFVPTSLEALIGQMITTLPENYALIIQTRALLETTLHTPITMDVWAYAASTSQEQIYEAIPTLQNIGLLVNETIAHSLFAAIIIQHIDPLRKRDIARRTLHYLEKTQSKEALAFLELAELPRKQTLTKFKAVMNNARKTKDGIAWAHLASRAINYAPKTLQANWAFEAANILMTSDINKAVELAKMAYQLNPKDVSVAVELARCYQYLGKPKSTIETLLTQLPEDALAHPDMLSYRLRELSQEDDFVGAIKYWYAHPNVSFTYANLNIILYCMAQVPQYFEQVEPLAQKVLSTLNLTAPQQATVHNYRAFPYVLSGRSQEALECYDQGIKLATSTPEGHQVLSMLKVNRAYLYERLGRYQEMFQDLEDGAQFHLERGDRRRYASIVANLAKPLTDQGNYARAETLLLQAQKDLSHYPVDNWTIDVERNLSYLYSHWSTPSSTSLAIHYAQRAIDMTRNYPRPEILVEMLSQGANVFAKANDWVRAQELCREATELAKTAKGAELALLEVQAILAEHFEGPSAALVLFQQCHDLAIQEEQELTKHLASLELARVQHDKEQSQQERAWFAERNLQTYVTLCDKYFPATAVTTPLQVNTSLHLRVLGKVILEKEGKAVHYSGSRRLEILCYLLEARMSGQHEVTFNELAEIFYSEFSNKEAKHILKQTIYLIRKNLGQEVIISTTNGYALGSSVRSDAEDFLQSPIGSQTQLWRDEYLKHFSNGWNPQIRESLLVALRRNLQQNLDPSEIQRLGNILLNMEPYDLDTLQITLKAIQYISLKQAVKLYQTAKVRFDEVGETLPKHIEEFLNA